MKSPLRYPGGKKRYLRQILPHIPPDVTVASPFFGGGHVELACIERGQNILGNDAFLPLANFWRQLKSNREKLVEKVQSFFVPYTDETRDRFYQARQVVLSQMDIDAAAYYFLINRCSFSGATLSGGFSQNAFVERFTKSSIERLASVELSNLSYFCSEDFERFLTPLDPTLFIYADPPYFAINGLYGHNGDMSFVEDDHKRLADALLLAPNPFVLSYNDCPEIRALYRGCQFIELAPSKSMSNGKTACPEVLILKK